MLLVLYAQYASGGIAVIVIRDRKSDINTGKPLFIAPRGRTFSEFITESTKHGSPSFRDQEVVWENVRCLSDGETVSVDGTHLGHNRCCLSRVRWVLRQLERIPCFPICWRSLSSNESVPRLLLLRITGIRYLILLRLFFANFRSTQIRLKSGTRLSWCRPQDFSDQRCKWLVDTQGLLLLLPSSSGLYFGLHPCEHIFCRTCLRSRVVTPTATRSHLRTP